MPKKKKTFLSKYTKNSQKLKEQRDSQDEEEKSKEKEVLKERVARIRANETDEKRSERLAINRQRTSTARKSEKIESDKVAASNDLKVCALFFKFLSKKFVF